MEQGELSSSMQKDKEKLCAEILSNGRLKTFLTLADIKYGVGKEAAFVAAIIYAGKDVFSKLVISDKHFVKLRRPDSDLALVYRFFKCFHPANPADEKENSADEKGKHADEKGNEKANEKGKKLLRKICKNSKVKMAQLEFLLEVAHEIAKEICTNYKFPGPIIYPAYSMFPEKRDQFKGAVKLGNLNGFLAISALSEAFCRVFDQNICTFYDMKGDGEGAFYHSYLDKLKQVILPERCTVYENGALPQSNKTQIVALELQTAKEDPEKWEAYFVCRLTASLNDAFPVEKLLQVKINIGPLLAEKLLSKSSALTVFQSYNPANGVLTATCTSPSALKLRQLAKNAMDNVYEKLYIRRNLKWFDEDSKTLVTVGPGFEIFGLVPHPSEEEKTTVAVAYSGGQNIEETNPAFENFAQMAENFQLKRYFQELIVMQSRKTFCASLSSCSADFKKVIQASKFFQKEMTIEHKFGDFFEFLTAPPSTVHKAAEKNNSYPAADSCTLCLNPIDDRPYVRLLICGHVYCTECLIGLLTQYENYPIHCQGCKCPIFIEDMALLMLQEFSGDMECIRELLEPVLRKSLEQYLQNKGKGKYVRCLGEQCNCILETKKDALGMSKVLLCEGCQTDRCTACGKAEHKGITCEQMQFRKLLKEHPELITWKKQSPDIRRFCPNIKCQFLVEKNGGCSHMECPYCHVHFCWRCEFHAITSREVYGHMMAVHGRYGNQPALPDFDDDDDDDDQQNGEYRDQLWEDWARLDRGLRPWHDSITHRALVVQRAHSERNPWRHENILYHDFVPAFQQYKQLQQQYGADFMPIIDDQRPQN